MKLTSSRRTKAVTATRSAAAINPYFVNEYFRAIYFAEFSMYGKTVLSFILSRSDLKP